MTEANRITADEFCSCHHLEISFIESLDEFGLIRVVREEKAVFIPIDQLSKLEQLTRLRNDLDVNLEGIDVINHLLGKMNEMQNEILSLRNRLSFYETI